eukprot:scaffold3100_cov73-Phaeocystis_antarctica.AAC.2
MFPLCITPKTSSKPRIVVRQLGSRAPQLELFWARVTVGRRCLFCVPRLCSPEPAQHCHDASLRHPASASTTHQVPPKGLPWPARATPAYATPAHANPAFASPACVPAIRRVTPDAGSAVSLTTPRYVLGRSSDSPLTQRSRSAGPRL